MIAHPGDILIADIPFIQYINKKEKRFSKSRTVVVVSSYEFNCRESVYAIVVVPITGNLSRLCDDDVHITSKEEAICKLKKMSVARAGRIITIGKEYITGKLGRAPQSLMNRIYDQIRNILGLVSK